MRTTPGPERKGGGAASGRRPSGARPSPRGGGPASATEAGDDRMQLFAVTAPGLEPIAERELRAMGIANPRAEPGGVAFAGRAEHLYRANLWLRTASRVVVRMGEFHATTFRDLEREARLLPWERFVAKGAPVRVRVTCRKSKLYHSDAVAERMIGALAHRVGGEPAAEVVSGDDSGEREEGEGEGTAGAGGQLFVVRFLHDRCTVSADASGALLHMRGYRQAVGKAPLRETLAAALLLGAAWDGTSPLVDPLCGSGTIAIEGAMIARRMAPGARRRFAFMDWPGFDEPLWRGLVERAAAGVLAAAPAPILASDRDGGATAAAAANAERAGVAADVAIATQALSHAAPPEGAGPGLVATNPPYGVRVGDQDRLRNLYAQIGKLLDARFTGWRVALLSADRVLEGHVGLPLREALRTSNGGIPVRVVVGEVGSVSEAMDRGAAAGGRIATAGPGADRVGGEDAGRAG